MQLHPHMLQRLFRNRLLQAILLVALGTAIGLASSHYLPWMDRGDAPAPTLGTRLRPGPWGELYSTAFSISPPEELLPIRTLEAGGTHWFFKNFALSQLTHLFDSADLPENLRRALLDPAVALPVNGGIDLVPASGTVIALPPKARQIIYRELAQFPENRSAFTFIHKSTLDERFDGSGVSRRTLDLFRALCSEQGDYLLFGGLPAMLGELSSYEEKVRFMKALTRQKTMLVRLRVAHDANLPDLLAYWGRGYWTANTRAKLEAMRDIPTGNVMNLMSLLPPEPASHLNDYPVAQPPSANGPAPIHDCHWTSLNFFRDTSDEEVVDAASFAREISEHYYPVTGDTRYGDILVLTQPDGNIVHSAVYIADDIVYTKNGATPIYPWVFATIPDLLRQYAFLAPEGQQLALHYFRSKEL